MSFQRCFISAIVTLTFFVAPIMALAAETYSDGVRALNGGDTEKAVSIWKPLAEKGDVDSLIVLGQMYATGQGVQKSIETAMGFHLKASEILRKSYKADKALEYVLPYARLGFAEAKNELVRVYLARRTTESYESASNILSDAFVAENAEANYLKGLLSFRNSKISIQDRVKALVKWQKKSAEMGYALGQASLGAAYVSGRGVEQSYEKAIYWYKKAVAQDTSAGLKGLSRLYKYGNGVEKDEKEAARLMEKAAAYDDYDARIEIAKLYQWGLGVEKNLDKAIYWYGKAADIVNGTAEHDKFIQVNRIIAGLKAKQSAAE